MARYRKRRYQRKRYKRFKRRPAFKRRGYSKRRYTKRRGSLKPARPARQDIMPAEKTVTLRWCESYGITASASLPAKLMRVFNASSPYDPDVTGLGTKAKGFDFYANYYRRYTVIASKCCLRYYQQYSQIGEDQPGCGVVLCGNLHNTAQFFDSTSMDYRTWNTCADTKCKFIQSMDPGMTKRMTTMQLYYNQKRQMKVYNLRDYEASWSYTTGSAPVCSYYSFAHGMIDLVSHTPPVMIFVTIDYKVRFFDRKTINWTLTPPDNEVLGVDPVVHPYAGSPAADEPTHAGIEPPLTPPP